MTFIRLFLRVFSAFVFVLRRWLLLFLCLSFVPDLYGGDLTRSHEEAAKVFSRCGAFYMSMYLNDPAGVDGIKYRRISEVNIGFAMMLAGENFVLNAVDRARAAIAEDVKGMSYVQFQDYWSLLTVDCASVLFEYAEELKKRGAVLR